jgi:hypothetical protein
MDRLHYLSSPCLRNMEAATLDITSRENIPDCCSLSIIVVNSNLSKINNQTILFHILKL